MLPVTGLAIFALMAAIAPAHAASGPSVTSLANDAVAVAAKGTIAVAGSQVTVGGVTLTAHDAVNSAVSRGHGSAAVMTVLRDGDTTASFEVGNGVPVTKGPGGTLVLGSGDVTLGVIKAPWAVDATGRKLATSYSIVGSTITQSVDTKGASYPIVADPSVFLCDWWTSICVKTSWSETRRVNDAMIGGIGATASTFCGLIPWSPWYAGAVRAACIGVIAAYFIAWRGLFKTAAAEGRCVEIHYFTTGLPKWWKIEDC